MVIDDSRRCPFFSGRLRPPSRNGLIHQLSGRYRFDTYTVANRTGSLFDRKIGGLTGLETWLRISVPNEGGEFRVDYDATVSDGDFKIVFVDEKNVDTVCEGTARGSRVFTLDRGEYALKAVGAHASAEIAFELQASEGITAVATGDAFDDDQAVDLEPIES